MERPSPPRRELTVNPVAALPARRGGKKEGVCSIDMSIPLDLGNVSGAQFQTAVPEPAPTAPAPPDSSDLPAVMTADEVAEFLRVDRKTVYDAVKDGTLPALRLRKVIRFCREEVVHFLRGSTRPRSSRSSR